MLLLSGLVGITYSLINIYSHFNEYKVSAGRYEQLSDMYSEHKDKQEIDLKNKLSEINQDYVGWITVDGTDIEYPVVLGEDNDYYLNHNFHKEEDKVGAIFMDYRNSSDALDKNTIIYGHNMKDQSMFSGLKSILSDDLDEKRKIKLDFQGKTYEWEIITAYTTRNTDWMQVEFESDYKYTDFLKNILTDSHEFLFAGDVTESDKVITLATCTTHIRDERIVVQGKLIKEE